MFEQALAQPLRLVREIAAEAAAAVESRVMLLQLEWQGEKAHLKWMLMAAAAALGLGLLALMFTGLAVIVWYWDTPQRFAVAGLVAATAMLACGVSLVLLVETARRRRRAFDRLRKELAADWRLVKDRL